MNLPTTVFLKKEKKNITMFEFEWVQVLESLERVEIGSVEKMVGIATYHFKKSMDPLESMARPAS